MVLIRRSYNYLKKAGWLAYLIAVAGVALYGAQLWVYAHTQTSLVDEGAYLYMGYQFALGTYQPYQDFGLWMNYAPFSYLIPGVVQFLFGPGLRTGRYFSVILSIFTAIILWALARRLGGKWWAAALVWAIALSPIPIKIYSHVLSQVLVAFFLAGALFFTLGEKRPLWQIIVGSVLAGILVMSRHTMVPLLPLLVAYVFWQHGKKAGWRSIAGCLLPPVIVHIIFWPNILQLWSFSWLPTQWIPYLSNYRPPVDTMPLSAELDPRTQLIDLLRK
ncbi:MAG: glycosyltransferase family 39 protein [Chloroflexi bacterium]|nr:glycosyltransferase family 39 protein [Chloroflexota bacterium]